MSYHELEKVSQQRWITEGPNREGVSGYLLVGDLLYFFYEEPGMSEPTVVSNTGVKDFISQFDGKTGDKMQAIVDFLKSNPIPR